MYYAGDALAKLRTAADCLIRVRSPVTIRQAPSSASIKTARLIRLVFNLRGQFLMGRYSCLGSCVASCPPWYAESRGRTQIQRQSWKRSRTWLVGLKAGTACRGVLHTDHVFACRKGPLARWGPPRKRRRRNEQTCALGFTRPTALSVVGRSQDSGLLNACFL